MPSDDLTGFASLLDHLNIPIHEAASQVAALLLLRWIDPSRPGSQVAPDFGSDAYRHMGNNIFNWSDWSSLPPHELKDMLGSRLPTLFSLEYRHQKPTWAPLHHISVVLEKFRKWHPIQIADLVQYVASQPLESTADSQLMLASLDTLLAKAVGRGGSAHADFLSLPWLSTLVAAIARPMAGDRIYDPCFGTAGFLVACHRQALTSGKIKHGIAKGLSICGVENNEDALLIGLVRLELAGCADPRPQLIRGNCLERGVSADLDQGRFDLVVANPPWGMRIDRFSAEDYAIPTTDAVGLYIQHIMAKLRTNGRAVIMVPQGLLFRGGNDQRLREFLIQRHCVEAVISLPAGAFKPITAIAANILVVSHKGPTKRIRMVDAQTLFAETKRGEAPSDDQIHAFAAMALGDQTNEHEWFSTVEEIAEAGWDLTVKRRDQSGLELVLGKLRLHTPVIRLEECCEIIAGRSIKGSDLVDKPPIELGDGQGNADGSRSGSQGSSNTVTEDVVPFIRIGDIRKGVATKGTHWLGAVAASTVDPRWKLKAGDVLISKSGTIGKVGVVRSNATGGVAANGLLVLRPQNDRLDPHYLTAFLASSECQAWLMARTRGAVMNHLTNQVLKDLPIPLPSMQVQLRIAEHHGEHGVDALAYLAELLIEGERDPIVEWMDQALQTFKLDPLGKPHDLALLLQAQVFGRNFAELRNQIAHHQGRALALSTWIFALHAGVVPALSDCDSVPAGAALYSLLQQAEHGLKNASNAIEGHLPHANRARDLTQLVTKKVQLAQEYMLEAIDVVMTTAVSSLELDTNADLDVRVANRGALPLREVKIGTHWLTTKGTLGFLPEGQEREIYLAGKTPSEGEHFSLKLQWAAIRMDGKPCNGSYEIAFELRDGAALQDVSNDFGPSPYVCGDPITPKRGDVFVGRKETLDQIRRQIATVGNVVLLEGNRRAGKTSILKHLEGMNGVSGWLGVYASLQGAEGSKHGIGVPTDEIFRTLAREIAKAVNALGVETPLPNGTVLPAGSKPLTVPKACREGISTESPFTDFQAYLEVILEDLTKRDLGLLLMLDEFDKLQEGIDHGVTSPQVPENIRFLVQNNPRFSAILTGSRRLQRMREEYWSALYGLGTRIGVTALDQAAAERLITQPVKGRLTYSDDAIRRVIFLTAGQPYLLQCLCNRIYDLAAQMRVRAIQLEQVENAAMALIEDNEHFASLWDYAGGQDHPHRRRYLLCLAHREGNGADPLRLGVIQERLLADGIEADDEAVVADLGHLRELELIDLIGDGASARYQLSIPLMGTWIDRQRDVAATLAAARAESEDHDA